MDDVVNAAQEFHRQAEFDKLTRENARLQTRLAEANQYCRRLQQSLTSAEDALNVALGTQDQYKTREFDVLKRNNSGKTSCVLVLSDFHGEEQVLPETVNYRNEYSLEIAEKRLERTFQKTVMLCEFVRHIAKIDELVVALLGDLMTGHIHDELVETCRLSPTETVVWLEGLLVSGIQHLMKHVPVKRFRFVTALGNHGRDTHKQRIATESRHSYEAIIYHHLRKAFPDSAKVSWQIDQSYHHWVDIQGHDVRFHHGHFLKYQGGVGGLTIPVLKAISKWDQERQACMDVFGHWHHRFCHNKFFANGSIIGWSPFSVAIKAEYQEPSQGFLVFDREYGCTMPLGIYCEEPEFFRKLSARGGVA